MELSEWQRNERNSRSSLLKRLGVAYQQPLWAVGNPDYKDIDVGADLYIKSLASKIRDDCNASEFERGKAKGEKEPHLMSDPSNAEQVFTSANYFYPSKRTFLDLGCGSGFFVCLGLELGYDCYGIDRNPKMVDLTRKTLEKRGHDPQRIILAEFSLDEFWNMSILGNSARNFDFYYLYQYANDTKQYLKSVSQKIKSGSHLIMPYWFDKDHDGKCIRRFVSEYGLTLDKSFPEVLFFRRE